MRYLLIILPLVLPMVGHAQTFQQFLYDVPDVINLTIIPFFLGVAFLVFVWGVIKYFIIQSTSDEGRQNAKNLITFSLTAFILLVIFWGLVLLITVSIGLEGEAQPCPDYPVGLTRNANGVCE